MQKRWMMDIDYHALCLFAMDIETMTRDHVIDEWMPSDNWRNAGECLEDLPVRFPYIRRDNGVRLGAWLNDVAASDGGGTSPPSIQ